MDSKAKKLERMRRTRGCLTDCIAWFLDVHPESVPYFVHPRRQWLYRTRMWLWKKGYKLEIRPCFPPGHVGTKERCLVQCDSMRWKTYSHIVAFDKWKMVYDPDYPTQWKDGRATHVWHITKKK